MLPVGMGAMGEKREREGITTETRRGREEGEEKIGSGRGSGRGSGSGSARGEEARDGLESNAP